MAERLPITLSEAERDLMAAVGDLFDTADATPISRTKVALVVDAARFDRFLEMLEAVSPADAEPSLSAVIPTETGSQEWWGRGANTDAEGDEHDGREPDDDDEPSLGSLDRAMNQARWAAADRTSYSLVTDAEAQPEQMQRVMCHTPGSVHRDVLKDGHGAPVATLAAPLYGGNALALADVKHGRLGARTREGRW